MGTRETDHPPLWIATSGPARAADDAARCDRLCARFYAADRLAPGRYFRLVLVGSFEGRLARDGARGDGLPAAFWVGRGRAPPDHSTIARTRRLTIWRRTGPSWVQQRLVEAAGRVPRSDRHDAQGERGERSIVRRDTGESSQAFLGSRDGLGDRDAHARGSGATDRKKKTNTDWTHPHDPDATKMKDGVRIWRTKPSMPSMRPARLTLDTAAPMSTPRRSRDRHRRDRAGRRRAGQR